MKPKRVRVDPSKVPERAWAAADYLRSQILQEDAAAMVGVVAWKSGWVWKAGATAGTREGDGGRGGRRLAWADAFRKMHARLTKALRNADPNATPEDAWREIARSVHWLFHGQAAGEARFRFRVQSPDSLAEKWDAIQRARRQQAENQTRARGADGRPDPMAGIVFKRLGGGSSSGGGA